MLPAAVLGKVTASVCISESCPSGGSALVQAKLIKGKARSDAAAEEDSVDPQEMLSTDPDTMEDFGAFF